MNIYERISKVLYKKWSSYGSGPEKFMLNVHHWHELENYFSERTSFVLDGFSKGMIMFLGTKLILRS